MTVKLAMYKGKGTFANQFIRWWTGSIYSHCELVVGEMCYSSSLMDGGVRWKVINLNSGNWDLIELPWASGSEVVRYFVATDHQKYGLASLVVNQLFNRNVLGEAPFCSEWCADALGLPNPATYSPATLMGLCGYIHRIA
ncbi:MAG: hypothetical protein GX771_04250 [Halomonadaceae bacterium]|nr:hypothetical protein [Halomonadaceae bacterium]